MMIDKKYIGIYRQEINNEHQEAVNALRKTRYSDVRSRQFKDARDLFNWKKGEKMCQTYSAKVIMPQDAESSQR